MGIIGSILIVLGMIVSIFGGIWLLIEAFKTNIWWGLGCLFISFISLVFIIMHFDVAKKPFFISLAGTVIMIIGSLLVPMAIAS